MDASSQNPAGGPGSDTTQTMNFKSNFAINRLDRQDPTEGFLEAMAAAGIVPVGGIDLGERLLRFRVTGDRPGSENGWAVFHADPPASGAFGNWKTGIRQTWCAKNRDTLTTAERDTLRRRVEVDRVARAQEADKRHFVAQKRAFQAWQAATPVEGCEHDYLRRKGVSAHGLRVGWWQAGRLTIEGCLLIPMTDFDGVLWSLQAIFPTKNEMLGRDKDFLGGGRKAGLFHTLGKIDPTGRLILAEGYATAATLFETLGEPVLCCFDAGNLLAVATEARRRFPKVDLVIAADNDRFTKGNPGLTKARAAALTSGARLLVPIFADDEPGSDWNDWQLLKKEAANVKSC